MLPAKAKYAGYDRRRSSDHFGIRYTETPASFPILTVMACLPSLCFGLG
jgi:hypothetical protein